MVVRHSVVKCCCAVKRRGQNVDIFRTWAENMNILLKFITRKFKGKDRTKCCSPTRSQVSTFSKMAPTERHASICREGRERGREGGRERERERERGRSVHTHMYVYMFETVILSKMFMCRVAMFAKMYAHLKSEVFILTPLPPVT